MTKTAPRCNCGSSCGENRYHVRGSPGCMFEVKKKVVDARASTTSYGLMRPTDGNLITLPNGAPHLFPTPASASRAKRGKVMRTCAVVPVALSWVTS